MMLQQLWPATDNTQPPAIVINLDRSPDRLADFVANNQRYLPGGCYRLPAVDGSAYNWQSALAPGAWGVNAGAVGCYLSHLHALAAVIDQIQGPCLVFEDDAKLLRTPPDLGNTRGHFAWLAYFRCAQGPVTTHALYYPSYADAETVYDALNVPIQCPVDNYLAHLFATGKLNATLHRENETCWMTNTKPQNPWIVLTGHASTINEAP